MELSEELIQKIIRLATETAVKVTTELLEDEQMAARLREACRKGEKAVLTEQTAIRKRERKRHIDRRLHNTRLLLKNYRMLKAHFTNAVYRFEEEELSGELKPGDIWEMLNSNVDPEEIYIEAICKSAARTMVIIQHIDKMLGLYSAYCDSSPMESVKRQCRILHARYLDEPQVSMADIAEREHVHRRTAEKDLDAAIESLTAIIFGIDAIKDLSGGVKEDDEE